MKYSTRIYAAALVKALNTPGANSPEQAVKKFVELVRKNGDGILLKRIVKETADSINKNSGIRRIVIESARELNVHDKEKIVGFAKPDDIVTEKINPELIAGVRIIIDDELQMDGTLRGRLDKMFENI